MVLEALSYPRVSCDPKGLNWDKGGGQQWGCRFEFHIRRLQLFDGEMDQVLG